MANRTSFSHMVYFWLKDGADADSANALAQGCRTHLAGIEGVQRLAVGFPAGTKREVVDNTYGVALRVEFADAQAHAVYQEHADHLRFIAECSHLWARVQVYDTLVEVHA